MKLALILLAAVAAAQDFSQRGFLESTGLFFPQAAANDSSHAVGEWLFRYEASYKLAPGLKLSGGIDARTDTHRETERELGLSWWDRERRRPLLAVRRLSATYTRGKLTVEAGKQFIRWGKTDILNPTDRFAPRDFLNVVENEFLGVTGARATLQARAETFEAVWVPRFTPSRMPLFDQRWFAPSADAGVLVVDAGAIFPHGAQTGVRWSHAGSGFETSVSFFNGFNHLPDIEPQVRPAFRPEIDLTRVYPAIRSYGADAAVPTRRFTIKAETAYVTSSSPRT